MPRDVDEKKTRKALRKLRKAKQRAEADGIELTDWEKDFVDGVDERLNKYGSAFADPSLGAPDEALSNAQSEILRQLDKKSRGKGSGGFKTRKPLRAKKGMGRSFAPRERQIGTPEIVPPEPEPETPNEAPLSPPRGRVIFRVIDGGKSDND